MNGHIRRAIRRVVRSRTAGAGAIVMLTAHVWAAASGCDARWQPRSAAFTSAQQRLSDDTPAVRAAPEVPAATTSERDKQVDQARQQVLAFIHRLDEIEQTKNQVGTSTQDDASAVAPDGIESELAPSGTLPPSREGGQDGGVPPQQPTGHSSAQQASSPQPVEETPPPAQQPPRTRQPPRVLRVSVRSPSDWAEPADVPAVDRDTFVRRANVANVPIGAPAETREEATLDSMIAGLSERVSQSPGDADLQWRLAMLRLAAGVEPAAGEHASELPGSSAVLLEKTVWAVSAARGALVDPLHATDGALAAVDALRGELRARAELSIPTVAFCSRVQAFGMYETLDEHAFKPGVANQAIVYFTVENFTSERTNDGRFRTLLSERLEVLDLDGTLLWEHEESTIEDLCTAQREDFFVAQRVLLPARLREGSYVLKVTVEDLLAAKRTQAIHKFQVGSAAPTAATP